MTKAAASVCPLCHKRPRVASARVMSIRGFVLACRFSERIVFGCTWCVRGELFKEALLSAVIGWFSPKALILNPFLVVANLCGCLVGVRANLLKGKGPTSPIGILFLFLGIAAIAGLAYFSYLINSI